MSKKPIPKAKLMADMRQEMRDRGLVPLTVYVKSVDRAKLCKYITRMGGVCRFKENKNK